MSNYPSRFIISSDMATTKKVGERTLTLNIPDSRLVPQDTDAHLSVSADISEFKSASFRATLTSSKYSGWGISCYSFGLPANQDGQAATIPGCIYRTNNTIEMRVQFPAAYGQATTWTGMGQTITAHIEFFVDPFEQ